MNEKHVAIFGSTGSIGVSALDVLSCLGADRLGGGGGENEWRVTALSTHSRVEDLALQVERFRPKYVVVTGEEPSVGWRRRVEGMGAKVLLGVEGMKFVAGSGECGGTVLAAVVGAAGLPAVVEAVRVGKKVALANKESLVVAGSVVMPLAKKSGAKILPVDSEHSAIFQAMSCGRREEVKKVILTASGGPFRTASREVMENATVEEALNHPTWRMGGKITIDSATLFNKAFELIEAKWLFDLKGEEIEVVVHPQSLIHSMVEFVDGNVMAQLSPPDMRTPIQYALTYPERFECPCRRFDWGARMNMTFEPPDRAKFVALDLAYEVAEKCGTSGAVINAANEVAVGAFLKGEVKFGAISETVQEVMGRMRLVESPSLEELMEADRWAREEADRVLRAEC